MTQLRAVALAAFFLGVGLAGVPFAPLHALLAAAILLLVAVSVERRVSPLVIFLVGFVGVLLTCVLQHGEIYPGSGIVAFGLGLLGSFSLGHRSAPTVVTLVGIGIGASMFFLL